MIDNQFNPKYLVALDEIYHSHWAARKRRRIAFLAHAFEHFWPEGHPTKLIQITGTNGKGTVAHYLEHGLGFTGSVGSWTGPHVFDYAERFHVDGARASHDEIADIYHQILAPYQRSFSLKHPGESLSFAELGILLALHLFARRQCAWALMEVGAGGRYTPLMALPMTACILTNIGEDHPKSLGDAIWQRALEKAGIARPDIPFFTAATPPALDYVVRTAEAEDAPVHVLGEQDITHTTSRTEEPGFTRLNLALAVKVIRHFYPDADPSALIDRMHGVNLPARFEEIDAQTIADIAHNPDKVARLVDQLQVSFPGQTFSFLVGLTRSRDPRQVFAPLKTIARRIVVSSASYAGQDPEEVARHLRADFNDVQMIADPTEALANARAALHPNEKLIVTGSAYLIDQALNPNAYVRHTNRTFGRRGGDL